MSYQNKYTSPLSKRYASKEMLYIFSETNKFSTWRKLWVALAESQKELGLDISEEQLDEMRSHITDIDFETAEKFESETRHDVMAHIRTYAEQCPKARPIIHLGATSSYVGDNTDIILQRSALIHIRKLLLNAINKLLIFANKYKALACLSYTHFQPAQPTTLGKRASLWIQDLLFDLEHLDFVIGNLKLLGCKGTTGTGASFLQLFDNDHKKVKALEKKIAHKMGFESVYQVSGQTYSRKIDYFTLSVLSGIAQSASKFSNDIRLLSHMKEINEPFETGQVGSSAMAYKKNPMRSERIASLARYVMVNTLNPSLTAAGQWFERTLDDSANRRISIPEAYLSVDSILSLLINISEGIKVYPQMIEKNLKEELPFMATENILMYCVKKGGDRQILHERIRIHSVETARRIRENGEENDLIKRIADDVSFNVSEEEIETLLESQNFAGRAEEQTEEFLVPVQKLLKKNSKELGLDISINV